MIYILKYNNQKMNILNIVKSLLGQTKKIDIKTLPTQGLFYNKDFNISIKKADITLIKEYENNYDKENLLMIIDLIKYVVRQNTVLNSNYKFEDIKSIDIVFLFLEIVKFTTKKSIKIDFFNDVVGKQDIIEFDKTTFNYFDFTPYLDKYEEGQIIIDGYKFSVPSIGLENCLTKYLLENRDKINLLNNISYDFLFFLGNKNHINFSEIENLITIFNIDLEDSEKEKVKNIVSNFSSLVTYSIRWNDRVIDVKSKLDLEKIWK